MEQQKIEKNIDWKLTKQIKEKIKSGEKILDIVSDMIKFEEIDAYDIVEKLPDSLITVIKKELAQKNYKIAKKDFPELNNDFLDDFLF
jgi:hypothetical protein